MDLMELLKNEAVLNLCAMIAVAVWAAAKRSEWYEAKVTGWKLELAEVFEGAVQQTYTEYVRKIKARRVKEGQEPTLSDAEREFAMSRTLATAKTLADHAKIPAKAQPNKTVARALVESILADIKARAAQ